MQQNNPFTGIVSRRRFVKVVASALSLPLLPLCSPHDPSRRSAEGRFRFIFCNDVHYRGDQKDGVMLTKILSEWKADVSQWDFAVVAGDLTNFGDFTIMKSVKEHFDKIGKLYYPVIGNHDVTAKGEEGKKNYVALFGEKRLNYLVIHKNVGLIFLDLANGASPWVTVEVSVKLWLKKTLAFISRQTPLIVFSHFPLHPETPYYAVLNSIELFRLLDKHNVLAYFSGHLHSRWSGLRNQVPFFTNVRLLPNWSAGDKYPGSGYMVVDVSQSGVSVKCVETNFGSSRNRIDEGQFGRD
ncbi:MAG TPA: metallophosphoesterase [Chitinivibrionales bacterium]|nr:metallophosphoesterase [Chitinivibrionales bacterium]